jgi:predicted ABC-type ATPase
VFLALASPELALARVRARVALGGHGIPDEVVHRRHARGLENLRQLYAPLATSWTLLDASDRPTLREHGGAGDPRAVERACRLGVCDALARHRLHGVPAPVWRDGAVVNLAGEQLLGS